MGYFLRHLLEWYTGIAILAFIFLVAPKGLDMKGPDAFFKAMLWPVITCEKVDTCNQRILGNTVDREELK